MNNLLPPVQFESIQASNKADTKRASKRKLKNLKIIKKHNNIENIANLDDPYQPTPESLPIVQQTSEIFNI